MVWLKNNWRLAAWLVLFALVVFFSVVLFPARRVHLIAESGMQKPVVDAWLFYSPSQLTEALWLFTPVGRQYYALTELTLDVVFPLLYGACIFLALDGLAAAVLNPSSRWRGLRIMPLFLICGDLLENTLLTVNLLAYPPAYPVLISLTAAVSSVKWVLGLACLALMAAAALVFLVKTVRKSWF